MTTARQIGIVAIVISVVFRLSVMLTMFQQTQTMTIQDGSVLVGGSSVRAAAGTIVPLQQHNNQNTTVSYRTQRVANETNPLTSVETDNTRSSNNDIPNFQDANNDASADNTSAVLTKKPSAASTIKTRIKSIVPDLSQCWNRQGRSNSNNYSLQYEDFQPDHDTICRSVDSLLEAIAYGSRVWNNATASAHPATTANKQMMNEILTTKTKGTAADSTITATDLSHSKFVTFQCQVPLLQSPTDFCRIGNQFQHIVLLGDSLIRQLHYALLMNFNHYRYHGGGTANLYNGSHLPYLTNIPDKCTCDGQFDRDCRDYGWGDQQRMQPSDYCPPDLSNFTLTYIPQTPYKGNPIYNFSDLNCNNKNNNTTKGILIFANGGLHLRGRAHEVYEKFILPWMMYLKASSSTCRKNVYFVWNSFHAHAPSSYETRFKHQSRDRAKYFNSFMTQLFLSSSFRSRKSSNNRKSSSNSPVVQVDFFNMSKDAPTSRDGVHFLSSVNYFKAQYLWYLADLMYREGRTLDFGDNDISSSNQIMNPSLDPQQLLAIHDRVKHYMKDDPKNIPGAVRKWTMAQHVNSSLAASPSRKL